MKLATEGDFSDAWCAEYNREVWGHSPTPSPISEVELRLQEFHKILNRRRQQEALKALLRKLAGTSLLQNDDDARIVCEKILNTLQGGGDAYGAIRAVLEQIDEPSLSIVVIALIEAGLVTA